MRVREPQVEAARVASQDCVEGDAVGWEERQESDCGMQSVTRSCRGTIVVVDIVPLWYGKCNVKLKWNDSCVVGNVRRGMVVVGIVILAEPESLLTGFGVNHILESCEGLRFPRKAYSKTNRWACVEYCDP